MIRLGIIGCGHWGPNHIRIFHHMSQSRVAACADMDADRLKSIHALYPDIRTTQNYRDILEDNHIDAVCIATPTNTHFSITREALERGKHVLCEKPLALLPEECLALKELSDRVNRLLMVGHIFVFNQGIVRLKEYISSGELGTVYYAHSQRTNLGPFRYDVNALWDLAPHDISIFDYLFDSAPLKVASCGQKYLGQSLEDVAFATLEYPGQILANVHVSWLDPKKVRQITIVGDKKMVVWDDLDNLGPIRLYDKHVERTSKFYESYGEFQLLSREGSITIPNMGFHEPLKVQAQYFIDCVTAGRHPDRADAEKGYRVVRTLCAAQRSIEKGGIPEHIA